ncbi:glycosyltransferase family 4 protein [uncultured Polaribacter sp.]|uniref:glycosyltransferase family 4 protein n=1 Tax=uncultured Polaribacter sp. TaxID=174711 RepID=UPI002618942F|nr:glycosyltransferase family 4 protein [uncultured Polaribacter sp.]
MHVVFLTNEYPKKNISHGGIGTFVHFLANKLILEGVKVTVLGINNLFKNEFEIDAGINVFRLKKSKWKVGKFFDQNRRIIQKIAQINNNLKIDIVEGSELSFAFFPKRTSYKKVIRLHGGHHFFAIELHKKPVLWRGYQEKKSFKNADFFVAVSNYVGKQTQQYLNYKFNYEIIYNSIKIENFYKADAEKQQQHKLLFIGTVCEKKGVENLVKAFALVKRKYPSAILDIIGRDWASKDNNSYINYLKNKYVEIVKTGIHFKGILPYRQIPIAIESATICVYPSISESFGLTIIEAMCMGKAIAVSDIEPFKEILGNSKAALLFNKESSENMAKVIIKLLDSKKNREGLEINSRKHILEKFDNDKILKQNIDFYKSVI